MTILLAIPMMKQNQEFCFSKTLKSHFVPSTPSHNTLLCDWMSLLRLDVCDIQSAADQLSTLYLYYRCLVMAKALYPQAVLELPLFMAFLSGSLYLPAAGGFVSALTSLKPIQGIGQTDKSLPSPSWKWFSSFCSDL